MAQVYDFICYRFLTNHGSQSLDVIKRGELLPGRRGDYVPPADRVLLPMSFAEYVKAIAPDSYLKIKEVLTKGRAIPEFLQLYLDELREAFNSYLITGGFPRPTSSFMKSGKRRIEVHAYDDIKYYIRGDIQRAGKNAELAVKILNAIADRLGAPTSMNVIAESVSCDVKTVKEYVRDLKAMFLLNVIEQPDIKTWTPIERKRKKIYFLDPFLLYVSRYMLFEDENPFEITMKELRKSRPMLVELVVAEHLRRVYRKVFFWRSKKGREIDFVIKHGYLLLGVEVKESPNSRDLARVDFELQGIPGGTKKFPIVVGETEEFILEPHGAIMPVEIFLFLLSQRVLEELLSSRFQENL